MKRPFSWLAVFALAGSISTSAQIATNTLQSSSSTENVQDLGALLRQNPAFASELLRMMKSDQRFVQQLTFEQYQTLNNPWLLDRSSHSHQDWITGLSYDSEFLKLMRHEFDRRHVDPLDALRKYRDHCASSGSSCFVYYDTFFIPTIDPLPELPQIPRRGGTSPFAPVSRECDFGALLEVIRLLSSLEYAQQIVKYEKDHNLGSLEIRKYRRARIQELITERRGPSAVPAFNDQAAGSCDVNDDLLQIISQLAPSDYVKAVLAYETKNVYSSFQILSFRMSKIRELLAGPIIKSDAHK